MKQKSVLLLLAFLSIMGLQSYAQEEQTEQSQTETTQNGATVYPWYVSIGGGPNLLMANQDGKQSVGDRMRSGGEISFGRWFSPIFGARLQFYMGQYRGFNYFDHQGGTFTNSNEIFPLGGDRLIFDRENSSGGFKFTKDKQGFWQEFNSTALFLDLTVNINRLIKDKDSEPDRFNVIGFVGAGFAHNAESKTNPTTDVLGARFGGRVNYNIQKNGPWSIYFEGNGIFFPEKYDGYIGDRGFDTNANTLLGVQYQF